ncbi:MAG: M15 family metallopeptidase [Oscillatoria sp. PMC 1051.18]|nr:M15 family metallopeptidase [Oscillatoria sp. PMC 1050.18]MEC5029019.1 M15 family metallopeptidase [Oscillatoria sp. PMC 1051.18]
MKPYQQIKISESGEPLVAIPLERFAIESPHPYVKLGADYGGVNPYYLRLGVVKALVTAQNYLEQLFPGGKILIFDAYRPVAVQQFMVDYTFAQVLQERGLRKENLSEPESQAIWQEVYQLWAIPSLDPAMPPPHATGAAVDVTLVDEEGKIVEMGSEIDELSPRSQPLFYAQDSSSEGKKYHANRELLHQVMLKAGFQRHLGEWWHFSLGDQMWAWLHEQANPGDNFVARYGRVAESG